MGILFADEQGAVIGIEANRIIVKCKDCSSRSIPIETLDGITILGNVQITTQCVQTCLERGISVAYFSKGGKYFGKLQSTGHINTERQRKQCELYQSEFSIELAKSILSGKLHNQDILLKRYERSKNIRVSEATTMINICRGKIRNCTRVAEMIGYEGQGAKAYFSGISKLVEREFAFNGRSRRPPRDEFNSMISLGYSILMNELYSKIEMKGLNPYFGFIHRDNEKHPTLASDMMEEWRAVIVDSTAISLINGHEIHKEHFCVDTEDGGCYLTKEGLRIFLNKLERKLQTRVRYLPYVEYPVSFRGAIALQIEQLTKAIEKENPALYSPILIR